MAVINALLCRLFCVNQNLVSHFQGPETEYICKVIANRIFRERGRLELFTYCGNPDGFQAKWSELYSRDSRFESLPNLWWYSSVVRGLLTYEGVLINP